MPADLTSAVRFFESRRRRWDHQVTDLTADLRRCVAPDGVLERASGADVTVAAAGPLDREEALAFERRHFPQWLRFFEDDREAILLAREARGEGVGSLLFGGPGRCSVFWPMLGDDMATIGCVGVAEQARHVVVVGAAARLRDLGAGICHIGWAWRPELYERSGYRPWRNYLMASRSIADEAAGRASAHRRRRISDAAKTRGAARSPHRRTTASALQVAGVVSVRWV